MNRRKSDAEVCAHVEDDAPTPNCPSASLSDLTAARTELDRNHPAAAAVLLKRLVNADPGLAEAHCLLSRAYLLQGRPSRAEAYAREAVRLAPDDAEAHAVLAEAQAAQHRTAGAVYSLVTALDLAPERTDLATAFLRGAVVRGEPNEVVALIADHEAESARAVGAPLLLGLTRLNQGQFEAAVAPFAKAIQQRPDLISARKLRAQALYQTGRLEEAAVAYIALIADHPDDIDTYAPAAAALSHLDRFQEALDICDRGLAREDSAADLRRIKAQALHRLDRSDEIADVFAPLPNSLLRPGYFELTQPLIAESLLLPGDLIECGVCRGGTTVALAREIEGTSKRIHACDAFGSLSEEGDFSDLSVEAAIALWETHGVRDRIVVHHGLFSATFPLMSDNRYCFALLDADFYVSMHEALAHVYPRMSPGGWIVIDDYGWTEEAYCKQAVDEFLADKPERDQFGCILGSLYGFRKL